MKYFTYILKCFDNSYYAGSTSNLHQRIKQHNLGKAVDFTSKRLPCIIIWYKKYKTRKEAIQKELEIKKFSRKKKENLIFNQNTIWKHYKGNIYLIINTDNELIYYAELKDWEKYYTKRNISGNQLSIYLRSKSQWLDWIDKKDILLRFNRFISK